MQELYWRNPSDTNCYGSASSTSPDCLIGRMTRARLTPGGASYRHNIKALNNHGTLNLWGDAPSHSWAKIAATAAAGDVEIVVQAVLDDRWGPGQLSWWRHRLRRSTTSGTPCWKSATPEGTALTLDTPLVETRRRFRDVFRRTKRYARGVACGSNIVAWCWSENQRRSARDAAERDAFWRWCNRRTKKFHYQFAAL